MDVQRSSTGLESEGGQALLIPDTIKSEVNFLIFPFFALSRRGLRAKLETEYREVIKRGDEKLEILWSVSANPKFGYPGPFDRGVHKAIEQIISETLQKDGRVENPIAVGSLYGLCKRIGLGKFGGREYRKIKEALERVTTTSVQSKGTFYNKGRKQWIEDVFHLYERVVLRGTELRDGEVADTNYLFLGSRYLESLNAFYVKPLDYKYLQSLRSNIASRLYEILGVRFYGLQNRKQSHVWFEYGTLCQLLPIEPQRYYSRAREKLSLAHTELIETRFLSKVRWQKRSKTRWIICYYPGEKAQEELKKGWGTTRHLSEGEDSTNGGEEVSQGTLEQDRDEKLVLQLTCQGISRESALQLVKKYPERIQEKIEILGWVKKREPNKIKDSAAYLRRMIEEDWSTPEGFVSKKEREAKLQELDREQRERAREAKVKAQEWAARPPDDRITGRLEFWIAGEKFKYHQPTEEEIAAKKAELISELPSREEYEQQLIDEIERDIRGKRQKISSR